MAGNARQFGHIPGVPVGTTFKNRDALIKAGVHAQIQAGIHGDTTEGAFSVCISQGYEDNVDSGDRITYVGSGGQDLYGQQIANQSFDDPRNKSLEVSCDTKRPVRVIRGKNTSSHYSPSSGYRYDGIYVVDSATLRPGKKGFKMCFFELRRIKEDGDGPIPARRLLTAKRMARMRRMAGNR